MRPTTDQFCGRAQNYLRHRPSYPREVLDALHEVCGVGSGSAVADVGSGTGIFTAQLLERGCCVFAVEPNREMRDVAEQRLSHIPSFHSIAGTAEETGLAAGSIDVVTVAQAFHWFRCEDAKREFRRILRPDSWIALVWNRRKRETPFQRSYEDLLRNHAPEFCSPGPMLSDEDTIESFFGRGRYMRFTWQNRQDFDLEGLKGRMQSSSYSPLPGDREFALLIAGLESAFDAYARDGKVTFDYETCLYVGKFESPAIAG